MKNQTDRTDHWAARFPDLMMALARWNGAPDPQTSAEAFKVIDEMLAAELAARPVTPAPGLFSQVELDRMLTDALQERDRYHDAADDLARYISEIAGVDIGEHSSENDPWATACDAARGYLQQRPDASAPIPASNKDVA